MTKTRLKELQNAKTATSIATEIFSLKRAVAWFDGNGNDFEPTVTITNSTVTVNSYTDVSGVQYSQFDGLTLKIGGSPIYTLPQGQSTVNPGTYTLRALGTITGDTGTERLYAALNYR
jgi:hypothetical protein